MAVLPQHSFGQLYYDTNGSTGGTSTSSTQNFTDPVWTTDPTGATATTGYTPNSDVIFSATDGINVGTGAQNVTVTDTESANSFTFNNGTVTLFGSGSPNLSIGTGGVAVNSTDGATTFDSSLGTVTVSADQSWNNNSTQAFNVNSNVAGSGNTLSFGGTGTGGVNLNGVVTGNLNLAESSSTSPLFLNNGGNNFSGSISANGGVIVASTQSALGNGGNVVNLSNGGTIGLNNSMGFNAWTTNIVVGTGGGSIAAGNPTNGSGIDVVYGGTVTGGNALNIVEGDFIPSGNNPYAVSSVNVSNARLLAFGNGIFGNGTAPVNVAAGGVLDFSAGATLNNPINLADGSALENRSSGMTLTNVIMPATGTVTVGADDVGGGSINIINGINLTGALTINVNENHTSNPFNNDTSVTLGGNITGTGPLNLTLIPGVFNEGTVFLTGNNSYSGPTTLTGVTANVSSTGFGTSSVTANSASIQLNGGTFTNSVTAGTGGSNFNLVGGAQTISGPIELSTSGGTMNLFNSSASNLTVGSIDFASITGTRSVSVDAFSTGSITLNGTYTSFGSNAATAGGSNISFGDNGNGAGNYYISSTADFSNFETNGFYQGQSTVNLSAGNLFIDNSSFIPGQVIGVNNNAGTNHTLEMVGSQNIQATIFSDMKHGPAAFGQFTINQSNAGESTISGQIQLDSTAVTFSAVSGGRLNIAGGVTGSSPLGLFKSGPGTVILSGASNYGLSSAIDSVSPGVTATVAMEIQQGTVLLANTVGTTPFGNNSAPVLLDSGATLGGTGFAGAQHLIVPAGTSSIIAPGDSGADGGVPTIGNLTLDGGLDTSNGGVTLAFKINGLSNDTLSFGGADFAPTGTLVVNFSSMNGLNNILSNHFYTFIDPTQGLIDGSGLTDLDLVAPYGYAIEASSFDTFDGLQVEFIAAPEPSTYALMLGGLAVLAFCVRRKTARIN